MSGFLDKHTQKRVMVLGFGLLMGTSQAVWSEQGEAQDSVYKWGRWAVLSPAAGGEAYVAALTPDAANNARPGEASEFQPEVELQGGGVPPGIGPIDPGQPPGNLPPPPPPPVGVGPIDPPAINLPPPPPPPVGVGPVDPPAINLPPPPPPPVGVGPIDSPAINLPPPPPPGG